MGLEPGVFHIFFFFTYYVNALLLSYIPSLAKKNSSSIPAVTQSPSNPADAYS